MFLKKGIAKFYVVVALVAIASNTGNIVSANNYEDEVFYFDYNGDGSDIPTKARKKTDNTYTYVRSLDDSEGILGVGAAAKKGIKEGDEGDPFSYDYCTDRYRIAIGSRKYFENKAYAKGFSTTYLVMASGDHKPHYYHGKWSPDNISGYK